MSTVIICRSPDSQVADAFIDQLISFIKSGNDQTDVQHLPNGTCIITVGANVPKEVTVDEPATLAVATDIETSSAPEIAQLAIELPPEEICSEPTVELPPPEVTSNPEPLQPAFILPTDSVVIKSLSTLCAVPCCFDQELPHSKLLAENVVCHGDLVSFNYCGLSFKFPVEKNTDNGCNRNCIPSATTIRVVLSFLDCDNSYACLLEVTEKPAESECAVIFGTDLLDMLAHEKEHHGK